MPKGRRRSLRCGAVCMDLQQAEAVPAMFLPGLVLVGMDFGMEFPKFLDVQTYSCFVLPNVMIVKFNQHCCFWWSCLVDGLLDVFCQHVCWISIDLSKKDLPMVCQSPENSIPVGIAAVQFANWVPWFFDLSQVTVKCDITISIYSMWY